jgi:hypothetical protein
MMVVGRIYVSRKLAWDLIPFIYNIKQDRQYLIVYRKEDSKEVIGYWELK